MKYKLGELIELSEKEIHQINIMKITLEVFQLPKNLFKQKPTWMVSI